MYCYPVYLVKLITYFVGISSYLIPQAEIKSVGRNVNNLRYTDDTTLMAESEETQKPLDESESGE